MYWVVISKTLVLTLHTSQFKPIKGQGMRFKTKMQMESFKGLFVQPNSNHNPIWNI